MPWSTVIGIGPNPSWCSPFTSSFKGNPAAVCPLEDWIDDDIMQKIAQENNLSETAFFVKNKSEFEIRWFTPLSELDLAGHPTLATAHVILQELKFDINEVIFLSPIYFSTLALD